MNPNLFIRYQGNEEGDDSQIALAELGESLMGFDAVFKEFSRILRITVEPEIQAISHREGSVIIDVAAWWHDASAHLPFNSVEDFLQFLRLAKAPILHSVEAFFSSMEGVHKSLNDWAKESPVDYDLVKGALMGLFALVSQKLMKRAHRFKKGIDPSETELSREIQEELYKLIKKHGFKKALAPLTEDKAKLIEISSDPEFKESAHVDGHNMSNYLADDDQILPHLENGMTCHLTGTVTSLKSTRADRVTLQIDHQGVSYALDCLPAPGLTTKNYKDFYKEVVNVCAQVSRTSLYKKPKLHLHTVELCQPHLLLDETADAQHVHIHNT